MNDSNPNDLISYNRKIKAYTYMRSIKIFSAIDIVMCFFYGFIYWPIIATTLFPLVGYVSANTYKKTGIYFYIFYLFLSICWRISIIIYGYDLNITPLGIVINIFGILLNMWISEICFKGIKSLNMLLPDELIDLANNGFMPQRVVFYYY